MSLLDKLAVKPLLWAVVALACIAGGLGVALYVQGAHHDAEAAAAAGALSTAQAATSTARVERDAWKVRVDELAGANQSTQEAIATLQRELTAAQGDYRTLDAQSRAAIAAARASEADADRTLKAFAAKFQIESRRTDCAGALAKLEAACPALSGY